MTETPAKEQRTLQDAIEAFLRDRKATGRSYCTIRYYTAKLKILSGYCRRNGIADVESITPDHLRCFLLEMGERRKPGGVRAIYRGVKAFIRWYENEYEPPNYKNPFRKVKPPKTPIEPLQPVSLDDVRALLETCKRSRHDIRDKAVLLVLLDTGIRASELLALNIEDVDTATGEILIRKGKGQKPRTVFAGHQTRRAVRAWIKDRRIGPLFTRQGGGRLTYFGLRSMLTRSANAAGVPYPSPHCFRRAFALSCLRAGMDVFTLQRLMGHTSLVVLRQYLDQTTEDLRAAHLTASPVDRFRVCCSACGGTYVIQRTEWREIQAG